MNEQKIAIMVDSGCDVPAGLRERYGIYQLPLSIVFSNGTFSDESGINAEELYRRLETEQPSTSLPSGAEALALLQQIQAAGYEKVLAITISSGLSGTYNMLRLQQEECPSLEIFVIDSLNVSVGGGMLAVRAAELVEEGCDWAQLQTRLLMMIPLCKVFFHLRTLEYLKRGGRIGHVSALLGNALNLRPVISVNREGIYYTEAKVPGRKLGLKKLCECAVKFARGDRPVRLAVMHGAAATEAAQVKEWLLTQLPQAKVMIEGQISPALAVHTGPGLVGIGVLQEG